MNVEKFLKTIGRGVEEFAPKFASWDELVLSTGEQLKTKGIAVRKRRWILSWIEHYRQVRVAFFFFSSGFEKNNREWSHT